MIKPYLKLKGLTSNNGEEYIGGKFKKCCIAYSIIIEKSIPKTPQHNGIIEHMIMTINERAMSMRFHIGLPPTFSIDLVSTTVYLIN